MKLGKQRPKALFPDQASDSAMLSYLLRLNKTIMFSWQCNDGLHHVFFTFLLMVVAFSLFVSVQIYMDDGHTSTTPHALALHLDSFSVIDFRVIEAQLAANWTAKFVFINTRNDLDTISIHPFDLLAFYQRTNLVSCASVAEPLVLKTKYEAVMEVEFSPQGCNDALPLSEEVVHELEQDINKGKIGLKLKLDFETKHKGEASCDLDLEFNSIKLVADRFSGTLAQNCRIPLPASAMHA